MGKGPPSKQGSLKPSLMTWVGSAAPTRWKKSADSQGCTELHLYTWNSNIYTQYNKIDLNFVLITKIHINANLYSISTFKCKETFTNNIWEYGCSSVQTSSCCLLGKVIFWGVFKATFQEVLVHQTTLVWKDSTGSHFLWKQKKNLFSKATYPYTHILNSRYL